jgi:hypothetical protein
MEARVGIEPTHKGFADLSLTTWVPRLGRAVFEGVLTFHSCRSRPGWRRRAEWSGRRDLNSRPSPWQGDALPLSYSRLVLIEYIGLARCGQTLEHLEVGRADMSFLAPFHLELLTRIASPNAKWTRLLQPRAVVQPEPNQPHRALSIP